MVEVVPLENRYASLMKRSNDPINQSETLSDDSNQQHQQTQTQQHVQAQDRSRQTIFDAIKIDMQAQAKNRHRRRFDAERLERT